MNELYLWGSAVCVLAAAPFLFPETVNHLHYRWHRTMRSRHLSRVRRFMRRVPDVLAVIGLMTTVFLFGVLMIFICYKLTLLHFDW